MSGASKSGKGGISSSAAARGQKKEGPDLGSAAGPATDKSVEQIMTDTMHLAGATDDAVKKAGTLPPPKAWSLDPMPAKPADTAEGCSSPTSSKPMDVGSTPSPGSPSKKGKISTEREQAVVLVGTATDAITTCLRLVILIM